MQPSPELAPPGLPHSVLERMADGLIVQDRSGRIVRWNASAPALLGVADDDLAGRNFLDPRWQFVHTDGTPWPGDTHPAMLAIYSSAHVHERMGLRRADGSLAWFRVNAYPLDDPTGETAVATTFTDITDDHQQATVSLAAERRFRTAFQISPVGQLIVDPGGHFLDVNDAFSKLLGRPATEILSMDSFALATMEISSALSTALLAPNRNGIPATAFSYRRPSGDARRGLTQISAIDWPGNDNCSMVQVVDVTELEDSRSELERSVKTFDSAFDCSPIGMAVLDTTGTVTMANPAMERLTGRPVDELTGMSVNALVHPEDLETVLRLAAHSAKDAAVAVEHRLVRADGEIRWMRTHLTRFNSGDGAAMLAQSLDHTAQRRQNAQQNSTDTLTGLLTRDALLESFEDHVFARRKSGTTVAVMSVDVNDFESINTRLGVRGADQTLRRLGAAVQASLPATASIARLGGDVFAAIVGDIDEREARRLAERIIRLAADTELTPDDPTSTISVRVGIRFVTELDTSPAEVLHESEVAARAAKDAPNGIVVVTSPSPRDASALDNQWTNVSGYGEAIERALEQQQFVAIAEPFMALQDQHALPGYELLVRLLVPGGALLSLPKFERLAQRLGMSARIDRWMVVRSLHLLSRGTAFQLEVNLGPTSFGDPAFLRELGQRLTDLDVDPARLVLAVRERDVLDDMNKAIEFGEAARALGLGVCVDDFGSNLDGGRYLAAVGATRVKLLGQLVRSAVELRAEQGMVAVLTNLAQEAGAEVSAPFVNDQQLLDMLRDAQVDYAQGRLIGHPVPSDELLDA